MKYLGGLLKRSSEGLQMTGKTPEETTKRDTDGGAAPADGLLAGSPQDSRPCRFCDHGNPRDAKFCNRCGGQLNLHPCPECGAVADGSSSVCYICGTRLEKADGVETKGGVAPATLRTVPVASVGTPDPTSEWPIHRRAQVSRTVPFVLVGVGVVFVAASIAVYYARQRPATEPEAKAVIARERAAPMRPIVQPAVGALSPSGARGGEEPTAAAASCPEGVAALGLCPAAGAVGKGATGAIAHASEARPQQQGRCTPEAAARGACTQPPTHLKE